MEDESKSVEETAQEHLRLRRFTDAAKCFEKAAETQQDKKKAAQLLKKAAEAYAETRSTEDAGRCFRGAAGLLEKREKAACLMAYWKHLVLEIAGCQYDCGFEWRGATDGSHDSDHEYYQGKIREYEKEAVQVLSEALGIKGVKRSDIIGEAQDECRKRDKDGWGAAACRSIISDATR